MGAKSGGGLAPVDVAVVGVYAIAIFALAQFVAREKKGHAKEHLPDYFLASKNLPWWAIGASLIAANISAEQIVGMSGSGYVIGLASLPTSGWPRSRSSSSASTSCRSS